MKIQNTRSITSRQPRRDFLRTEAVAVVSSGVDDGEYKAFVVAGYAAGETWRSACSDGCRGNVVLWRAVAV
jgi:hypothetical protein